MTVGEIGAWDAFPQIVYPLQVIGPLERLVEAQAPFGQDAGFQL